MDHAQAETEPQYLARLLNGASDVNVVVGNNWTLSCDSAALCRRIEHDFGGKYVYIPA